MIKSNINNSMKLSPSKVTKYIIAFLVLATVVYTQALEIEIGREYWNLVTFIFTAIFGGYVIESVKQKTGDLWQSIMAIVMVGLVCYLTTSGKEVAKVLWGITTLISTYIFLGNEK